MIQYLLLNLTTNKFANHLSVIISALLLACAFVFPQYCAFWALFFLMPLYFLEHDNVTFCNGFLWGIIFFSLYFSGIFILLLEYASGLFKFPLYYFLLIYAAGTSGIWFMLTSYIQHLFKKFELQFQSVMAWTISTLLYFLYIHYLFFLPCGVIEGNTLLNPLILIHTVLPKLMLPCAHYEIQLLFFLGLQGSLYLMFYHWRYLIFAFIFLLPLWWNFIFRSVPNCSSWMLSLNIVSCVPIKQERTYWQQALSFAKVIKRLGGYCQNLIVITPESSFKFPLNQYPELISQWNINNGTIIVGAYRVENDNLYNSLYVIEQCRITHIYDKTNLMFFTEHIPTFWRSNKLIKKLFLNHTYSFSKGKNKKRTTGILTTQHFSFIPYICSEFFFETNDTHLARSSDVSLLVLVNDSWFSASYIQELLLLYARYKATILNKPIIYVSYHKHCIALPRNITIQTMCYKY